MDVPDMMLNWEGFIPAGTVPEDSSVGIHAASMFTPGALMSGFRMFWVSPPGPLDEKDATTGAGL